MDGLRPVRQLQDSAKRRGLLRFACLRTSRAAAELLACAMQDATDTWRREDVFMRPEDEDLGFQAIFNLRLHAGRFNHEAQSMLQRPNQSGPKAEDMCKECGERDILTSGAGMELADAAGAKLIYARGWSMLLLSYAPLPPRRSKNDATQRV